MSTTPTPVPGESRSILVGGLAGFGLSLMVVWIPALGQVLCCGALAGTGLLAVWHRVAVTRARLPVRAGVQMGAQAGTVAFIASALLTVAGWSVAGRPNMASFLRNEGIAVRDAMQQDALDLVAQGLDQPAVVLVLVLVSAGLYTLLGAVGGALGAGVLQRADLPDPPEPPTSAV